MHFEELPVFTKELKRLRKKYPSLDMDLTNIKGVLSHFPKGRGEKHWVMLFEQGSLTVHKTRMMCRSLRGASFRLIYLFDSEKKSMLFVEIYYKGEQENENQARIQEIVQKYVG